MVLGADYGADVDPSRWVVIYPPYIDSTRTEKQVRDLEILYKLVLDAGREEEFLNSFGESLITNKKISLSLSPNCLGT